MNSGCRFFGWAAALLLGVAVGQAGAAASPLDDYDVTWDTPGPTAAASMPLGNGDIGLNVWAEPDGAVCFYIGKTDTWNDNDWWQSFDPLGLMKLGGVRLQVSPNPFTNGVPFTQVLKLHEGEILIQEGTTDNGVTLRLWVDANHPVIRVEATSSRPVTLQASLMDWRLGAANPDVVLPGQTNAITWYHRNRADTDAHVANLTFGATITGPGLVVRDGTNLVAAAPALTQRLTVHPLTAQTAAAADWVKQLQQQVAETDALDWETCRQAHRQWWDNFWQRSWVFLEGDAAATNVTRGYVLQRFVTACGGRGAYPIKFNGSLFVVDDPARNRTPDYRDWGGQYWFQNTRAMYWPRLAAGDFDLMLPLFRMYAAQVPGNSALVKKYYGHEGAYFAETTPFWGGLLYMGPEVKENWTGHYFLPVLEISMMMLDYYEYTGDDQFARDTLLPVASAGIKFYDQHFPRDAQGKLLLDPVNSIEMFWKVHDPAPDLAGLHAVLPRLIALTNNFVPPAEHAAWLRLLGELPELPVGTNNGQALLLPYTGPQTNKSHNAENPELYAIFPFRLYGMDRPDLQLARDTFRARKFTQKGCWIQDPIQAAMLGFAAVAKEYVTFNFTNREPRLKFPAFWAKMNDYAPDEDNGGCGEHALQSMLLQTDGRKILLLPAWPKEWNAQFKLNAPFNTIVEGRVEAGQLRDLVVTPPERRADVVDMSRSGEATQ